jgi:hypothetical protein
MSRSAAAAQWTRVLQRSRLEGPPPPRSASAGCTRLWEARHCRFGLATQRPGVVLAAPAPSMLDVTLDTAAARQRARRHGARKRRIPLSAQFGLRWDPARTARGPSVAPGWLHAMRPGRLASRCDTTTTTLARFKARHRPASPPSAFPSPGAQARAAAGLSGSPTHESRRPAPPPSPRPPHPGPSGGREGAGPPGQGRAGRQLLPHVARRVVPAARPVSDACCARAPKYDPLCAPHRARWARLPVSGRPALARCASALASSRRRRWAPYGRTPPLLTSSLVSPPPTPLLLPRSLLLPLISCSRG